MTSRRRLAVRVTKDAERHLRAGHPWLFDGSVTSVSHDGAPGDLAVVFDANRRFLAIGLYDPTSPIRVRVLHHGEPSTIDEDWFAHRIAESHERRRRLVEDRGTTAHRVVHGENDGLPGLVVDRYDRVAVLKLYSASWVPHLDAVVRAVEHVLDPRAIVLRLARSVASAGELVDGTTIRGEPVVEPVRYQENGLTFEADVVSGQKTGAFLDQRENRQLVRDLAAGRRVLDVFACTGGFSVHAAAGGAAAVHSVDLSSGAIATTRRNMELNSRLAAVRRCHHTTATGDAEREMRGLVDRRERFDLVVVDPPSFAQRAEQRRGALRAYERLAALAAELTEPGGLALLASCSSRVSADEHVDAVERGMQRQGRTLVAPRRTGHPLDHPVGFAEGAYLKAVIAEVDVLRGGRRSLART